MYNYLKTNKTIGRHRGIDIVVTPGEDVKSPVTGKFVRPAKPYKDDNYYSGVLIEANDGTEVKIFYVHPNSNLKPGDTVEAGKTSIGSAQDLRKRYGPKNGNGPITPHVHLETKKNGQYVDPTPGLSQK